MEFIDDLDVLIPGSIQLHGFLTVQLPNAASTKVAVVQLTQPHLQAGWQAEELLVEVHCCLDKYSFLDLQIMTRRSIFMKGVTYVLSFGYPGQVISIQLDGCQLIFVGTVKGHAHGFTLLRIWIRTEDQVIVPGMLLTQLDHLLQPLHRGGHDQHIICIGQDTIEVSTNRAAIPTSPERIKHWIKICIETSSWAEYAPLSCTIGYSTGVRPR